MTARTRQFYYVDTLTSTHLDGDCICRRYGLSASTSHNHLRKNKLSHQCGPPLIGQTMTRRHRLVYVSMCNGLDAISSGSVSTGTAFRSVAKPDLHSAMLVVKRTNKRCWGCYVLERDRFDGGSFVVWGGKMGDQKTYFVDMQDNFNALYRRHLVTSCHMPYHFSIIFTHKELK